MQIVCKNGPGCQTHDWSNKRNPLGGQFTAFRDEWKSTDLDLCANKETPKRVVKRKKKKVVVRDASPPQSIIKVIKTERK